MSFVVVNPAQVDRSVVLLGQPFAMRLKARREGLLYCLANIKQGVLPSENVSPVDLVEAVVVAVICGRATTIFELSYDFVEFMRPGPLDL